MFIFSDVEILLINYSCCGQTCVLWYSLAEKRRFVCWSMLEQTQTRLCSVRLWESSLRSHQQQM